MKFSIRDLFWLVLLAACCTLWWMDRVRLDRLQRQEAERSKQATAVMQFLNASLQSTPVPAAGTTTGPPKLSAEDQQITDAIRQGLDPEQGADGVLKGVSLDVSVEDGTVWMAGQVSTREQQDKALDIARRAQGVKQVVNGITVAPTNEK